MTGLRLLAKSRNLMAVTVGIVAVAIISYLVGDRRLTLAYGGGVGIPYATVLPLACACFVGLSARSPFQGLEGAASRSVTTIRVTLMLSLMGLSALAVGLSTRGLPPPVADIAAVRNLIGLAGLTLIAASLTGSRTSWVLPCCYVVTVLSLGTGPSDGLWAWILRPDGDPASLLLAVAIFMSGVAFFAVCGSKEPPQEE